MIHIPTALALFSFMQFACALVIGIVWWKNRSISGLFEWSIGRFLIVIAFLLFTFRDSLPLMLSVLLGNGLFLSALYFIWLGNVRFMRRQYANTHLLFMVVLMIALVLFAALTQVAQGYVLRVIIISILTSFYAVSSMIVFVQGVTGKINPLIKLIVLAYFLLFLIHFSRALFYLAGFGGESLLMAGDITAIVIVVYLFVSFLIVMLNLAMVVELSQEKLRQAADRDALTGAYNRRAFFTIVENLFARAKREQLPVSVLSIDLDYFKRVNDTYGHLAGDNVIKAFVNTSLDVMRTTDLFARYGGEEFVVVLPETKANDARKIAERIRKRFNQRSPSKSIKAGEVTCSIGIASVNVLTDNLSITDMLERSDSALYHAKLQGRNRVSTY